MSRGTLDYRQRRRLAPAALLDVDQPVEGYYRVRRHGGVWRPVRIWYGPPLDPVDGSVLDRGWRWNFYFCGRPIWDPELVWPVCAKNPIDRAEYEFLLARIEHARKYDPRDPFGNPRGVVDWLTSTPPHFE